MGEPAIHVVELGKAYRIGAARARYRTIRETISETMTAPVRRLADVMRGRDAGMTSSTIWALKDVTFDVNRGEVIGVIGRNGAGKTTLLSILSRITKPSEGTVDLYGRLGSLLEVGTGFHPELTGRENIYLSGSILGMGRAEIDRKYDEIVEFAETEKFVDTPVKRYSSGMYLRLAFSVAAHLETDIILVDEVLAVGDAAFQKKCLGKMGEVATAGRTVLFVSHNMAAITELCAKTILIEDGRLLRYGPSTEVVDGYLNAVFGELDVALSDRTDRSGAANLQFTGVEFRADGINIGVVRHGQPLDVVIKYRAAPDLRPRSMRFAISFLSSQSVRVLVFDTGVDVENTHYLADEGVVVCHIPEFPLLKGNYRGVLYCAANGIEQDRIEDAFEIDVISGKYPSMGHSSVRHTWEFG